MPTFDSEDEAFESIIKDALPDRMVTNFVLVAEVVGDDGEELSLFMSDSMTPWLALGMIKSASDMIKSNQSQSRLEDDDL